MPVSQNHPFAIYSRHRLSDGSEHFKPLYSTHSQEQFSRVCMRVMHEQANTPKPQASIATARAVVLRAITDPVIAYQARAHGLIKELPKLRTQWTSVAAAAEAIGISGQTLRQALYRARKENGGTDSPATVHGLCFAYVDLPAAI